MQHGVQAKGQGWQSSLSGEFKQKIRVGSILKDMDGKLAGSIPTHHCTELKPKGLSGTERWEKGPYNA